jgi:hypothetical protein
VVHPVQKHAITTDITEAITHTIDIWVMHLIHSNIGTVLSLLVIAVTYLQVYKMKRIITKIKTQKHKNTMHK